MRPATKSAHIRFNRDADLPECALHGLAPMAKRSGNRAPIVCGACEGVAPACEHATYSVSSYGDRMLGGYRVYSNACAACKPAPVMVAAPAPKPAPAIPAGMTLAAARFQSECVACHGRIDTGTRILYVRGQRATTRHQTCPANPQPIDRCYCCGNTTGLHWDMFGLICYGCAG